MLRRDTQAPTTNLPPRHAPLLLSLHPWHSQGYPPDASPWYSSGTHWSASSCAARCAYDRSRASACASVSRRLTCAGRCRRGAMTAGTAQVGTQQVQAFCFGPLGPLLCPKARQTDTCTTCLHNHLHHCRWHLLHFPSRAPLTLPYPLHPLLPTAPCCPPAQSAASVRAASAPPPPPPLPCPSSCRPLPPPSPSLNGPGRAAAAAPAEGERRRWEDRGDRRHVVR